MKTIANGTTAAQVNTNNRENMNAANNGASYNPDAVAHVILYADNSRDIYDRREWLAGCVSKVIIKGIEPDRARLINSVYMARIIKQAADIARRDEWCKVTDADEAQAREKLADDIIERAKEIAAEKAEKNDEK